MSVSNGQDANEDTFNTAFMSRTTNTSTVGQVDLKKPGITEIDNIQLHHIGHIQNPKIFCALNSDGRFSWDGSSLSFTQNILIKMPDLGVTSTVLQAGSPVALADGESAYVTLNRTANANVTVSTGATIGAGLNIFRLATRIGSVCILADGTVLRSGDSAGFGGRISEAQEVPAGAIDGANATFTLANTPSRAAAVRLYLNGLFQRQGTHYTISGATITMNEAPAEFDLIDAYYTY